MTRDEYDEREILAVMHSDQELTEQEAAILSGLRKGYVAVLIPPHQALAFAAQFVDILRMANQFEASGCDVTRLRLLSLIYTEHPNVDEQEVAQYTLDYINNAMKQDGDNGTDSTPG